MCGSKHQFGCLHAKLENVNELPRNLLAEWVIHHSKVPQFQQYGQVDCMYNWEPRNSWAPIIALTNDSFNGSRQFINPLCLRLSAKIGIITLCLPSSQDFVRNSPTSKFYSLYIHAWVSFISMGITLFHLKAGLSPSTLKIMLLPEDVKLKFCYTFIRRHMQNQKMNRRLLLLLRRDMTGKSKQGKWRMVSPLNYNKFVPWNRIWSKKMRTFRGSMLSAEDID